MKPEEHPYNRFKLARSGLLEVGARYPHCEALQADKHRHSLCNDVACMSAAARKGIRNHNKQSESFILNLSNNHISDEPISVICLVLAGCKAFQLCLQRQCSC